MRNLAAVHLGLTKQQLHGSQITSHSINLGNLGSAKREGAKGAWLKTDARNELLYLPSILSGRDVIRFMEAAWPQEV